MTYTVKSVCANPGQCVCGALGEIKSKETGRMWCRACVSELMGVLPGGDRLHVDFMVLCTNCGKRHTFRKMSVSQSEMELRMISHIATFREMQCDCGYCTGLEEPDYNRLATVYRAVERPPT